LHNWIISDLVYSYVFSDISAVTTTIRFRFDDICIVESKLEYTLYGESTADRRHRDVDTPRICTM